jgi:hypothetical protein
MITVIVPLKETDVVVGLLVETYVAVKVEQSIFVYRLIGEQECFL